MSHSRTHRWSRLAPKRGMRIAATLTVSAFVAVAGGLAAVGSAQAATLPTLTLALTKSSITAGGTLTSGGVNVVSTATGTKEAGAILFLLNPGVTPEEFYAFLASKKGQADPNNARKYGAIVFDGEVVAGKVNEAQTTLQAGQYVALLNEGEKPPTIHSSFTVTASASPVPLPTPQATIRAIEFGFRGPATLHVGELVRFENEGFLVHMNFAFPVKSKKAAKKVVGALRSGREKGLEKLVAGPPIGFTGPISSGAYQQQTITAKPGWYVEVCFMETQDKRPHTRLGMERIIKSTK
jgi:hypothetical protein